MDGEVNYCLIQFLIEPKCIRKSAWHARLDSAMAGRESKGELSYTNLHTARTKVVSLQFKGIRGSKFQP